MKLQFPINLKRNDFLETAPSLRSTWTFQLSSISLLAHVLITIPLLIYIFRRLPPLVPLWYSKPWGVERLVPPIYLLLPIGTSILVYTINILIANKTASDHPLFARILYLTSASTSVMCTIMIIKIIRLMT